jgi:patatin-related protein
MATNAPPVIPPAPPPSADVRELRLALVCYGGVSLAIYMHGVTRELHKLVRASAAYDRDQTKHDFEKGGSEDVYWQLLRRIDQEGVGAAPRGTRLRVVVDIIAGTSAGGINGICLGKALALNCSQDALRDLWFDNGDIAKLVAGSRRLPAPVRAVVAVARALLGAGANAPLRGDEMGRWLHDAFEAMDKTAPTGGQPATLLPRGHPLELYVTVTDLQGYPRELPIEEPRIIKDRMHRHVLIFRHGGAEPSSFGAKHNHALAFAARATSSFPGAFPPLSFRDYCGYFKPPEPDLSAMVTDQFAIYGVNGADPTGSAFVDGGVLDNAPFDHAVAAIRRRAASVQVDRRLLYIEPDPVADGPAPARSAEEAPGWVKTILASLSSVPAGQPILDELNDLAERNRVVRRIRDVIETNFAPVKTEVEAIAARHGLSLATLSAATPASTLDALRVDISVAASRQAGFGYASYVRLRVGLVLEGYAALISRFLGYPASSYPARFVENVVRDWAEDTGVTKNALASLLAQVQFLQDTDLSFHQRRLRFIIAAFSWWYGDLGKQARPTRADLDTAKETLYQHLTGLEDMIGALGATPQARAALLRTFPPDEVKAAARDQKTDYAKRHRADLDGLRKLLGGAVTTHVARIEPALYRDLAEMSAEWPADMRADLFARYFGFPFWDIVVNPIQALAGVDERDHVEVLRISPLDARHLGTEGPGKLKGIGLHHFAAFFKRSWRENDYLWGRLDAAERLVGLLLDDPTTPGLDAPAAECRPLFDAILKEEAMALTSVPEVISEVRKRVEGLPKK